MELGLAIALAVGVPVFAVWGLFALLYPVRLTERDYDY